ncbi:beta-N-acetylglucosaminidase domain-containing protein [Cellvibrio japonicus]|uniref:Hyaluronidase, putative, hyl84A n=1 Tax=Cellvibrio japonicus (strain Ueda107) TaxID=498211 RepID=B3PCY4_CELJU|nr:beta-N-acetylglucosaminidase domain-containing protein [Cellvibrio japonicus]ACE83103.1 hyaluronidase, putative, hyl84A [Cellvibrio japonicus Ueda107]QEI11928.1 hyaluronidase [Cellvibrio japonicus]QEI15502.1 hyaluronidase [Cellvibrio japonicus]QEI19081.1 hyaluronidase [Cellvibrio japonicus]
MYKNPAQPLGTIEGFFGKSWSWQERSDHLQFLARYGYDFYIYAPKSDAHLRRHWQLDWPAETQSELQKLRHQCHTLGLHFGIGLSPLDIYRESRENQHRSLRQRVRQIRSLQPDILCILFDDMRGDLPQLAQLQLDLVHLAASESLAHRLIFCPSYYSVDPVLEKVFGTMPEGYWQALGKGLDKAIDIFWTGEKVCSPEYALTHLHRVRELFQRKPFLWDNYPVNDGAIKSSHLHLRAFPYSHHQLHNQLNGHAINPMNQPWLSQLAIASLIAAYEQGAQYQPQQTFDRLAQELPGNTMAVQLHQHLGLFQDQGLSHMSDAQKLALIEIYRPFTEQSQSAPYAQEIIQWLSGEYVFDPACLTE